VAHSLRAQLLAWVLLPLASAVAVDAWITYRNARDTATVIQDRLLLGSARIVAEQLRFEEGEFQEHIPPSALELFQSGQDDRVYYRVTTGAGQLLSGYSELRFPKRHCNRSCRFSSTARCARCRFAWWPSCSPWSRRKARSRCWWRSRRPCGVTPR
jgi:hypothetical protein